ncbi:MAG: hypothetical protein ACM3O9_05295 [Methylocystaceae bacterium]
MDKWTSEGGANRLEMAAVATDATPALAGEGCDGTLHEGMHEVHQLRWYRRLSTCP